MASRNQSAFDRISRELRAFGMTYPGAHGKRPWPEHDDLAVKDKTFAFLSAEGTPFSISCKLPQSAAVALLVPGTQPTPYGLGRSGWVSFAAGDLSPSAIDVEMLKAWIDESYRAVAPARLLKELLARTGESVAGAPKKSRPATKKRAGTPRSTSARTRGTR